MKKILILIGMALLLGLAPGTTIQEATGAIINGDFETGDLSSWDTFPGGNVDVLDEYQFIGDPGVIVTPYEGDYMAMLGSEVAIANFNIYNLIVQVDPESYIDPVLNFAFNFWSYDCDPYDDPGFAVLVNGRIVRRLSADRVDDDGIPGDLDVAGWRYVSVDLTPFLDGLHENISISFYAGDTASYDNRTGVFLDAISITSNVTNVPVPGSLFLLATGILPLLRPRRRNS